MRIGKQVFTSHSELPGTPGNSELVDPSQTRETMQQGETLCTKIIIAQHSFGYFSDFIFLFQLVTLFSFEFHKILHYH